MENGTMKNINLEDNIPKGHQRAQSNGKIENGIGKKPKKNKTKAGFWKDSCKWKCLFCGGKKCHHELVANCPNPAIPGLHSSFVTENFIAMQRPSERLIKEHNVIQSFKDMNIGAIFNLQEPGEHAKCGDGVLKESGFHYLPETFFNNGIHYFNFFWKDLTITDCDTIFKTLSMIDFILKQKQKVAIHCHAGKGRTKMVICSWLIFKENYNYEDALDLFREKRGEGIGKGKQKIVDLFLNKVLKDSRAIFRNIRISSKETLHKHSKIMFGKEKEICKVLPFLLYKIHELFKAKLEKGDLNEEEVIKSIIDPYDGISKEHYESEILKLQIEIDKGNYELEKYSLSFLIQSLLEYLDTFVNPFVKNKVAAALNGYCNTSHFRERFLDSNFNGDMEKHEFETIILVCELIIMAGDLRENDDVFYRLAFALTSNKQIHANKDRVFSHEKYNSHKDENIKNMFAMLKSLYSHMFSFKENKASYDEEMNKMRRIFKRNFHYELISEN